MNEQVRGDGIVAEEICSHLTLEAAICVCAGEVCLQRHWQRFGSTLRLSMDKQSLPASFSICFINSASTETDMDTAV